jgi:hypothetical protein
MRPQQSIRRSAAVSQKSYPSFLSLNNPRHLRTVVLSALLTSEESSRSNEASNA